MTIRLIDPRTNPAGYLAAASAVLVAAVMIDHVINGEGVIDSTVIVAAVGAVSALVVRQAVTPVKDPKAANGTPLVPAPAGPAPVPPADARP